VEDIQLKDINEAYSEYRHLAEESLVGICITQDNKFVYVNQKVVEMFGCDKDQIIGSNVFDFVFPDDRELVSENIKKRINGECQRVQYEYRALRKDSTVIHMEVYGAQTFYKGKPAILGTFIDITARKKAEKTIEYMAYHDSLTGLYNRHYFYNYLRTSLNQDTTKNLAVLFLDLDRFKIINDSMDHGIGDFLLQQVSNRLEECVGKRGVLARHEGDEFIISLINMNQEEAAALAEKILHCFTDPFHIEQYEIYTAASIGVSCYPRDGNDVDTLIKKAEQAMYETKKTGNNNFQFYHSKQSNKAYERFEVEMNLHKALEHEEFQLHYQPKLNLTTGNIVGVEALIRWVHPEKGMISPAEFIPLAEETGLIIPIGEWVLRTACRQNKIWQEAGMPPIIMSINFSVRQLYQPNLIEMIETILKETGMSPEYLDIEITESMLIDSEQGMKALQKLKKIGVQISLDDFGTGYSSLQYLKNYPIDKLKIDQSFVRSSTFDKYDETIVQTIIIMAHQLGLEVVAEGVELKEHLALLQRNSCNEAQGYLFSKPLLPAEFEEKYKEIENNGIHKNAIKYVCNS